MVSGASLVPAFSTAVALGLVAVGALLGSALVASLSPVGPRLGVPSMVAARAALGWGGAALLAGLLYVTNFAWIAVNNAIAASVCARVAGGASSEAAWAVALGLLATAVVAGGPRVVALADRWAVPLLALTALVLTIACVRGAGAGLPPPAGAASLRWSQGLDVVVGYQVSWILMFADYSRYTASARRGAAAVFLGLGLTSLWFMSVGVVSARLAGSSDPGAMLAALGLGAWGAALMTLATVTTNFVNVYLSALAWRSLLPRTRPLVAVWSVGLVGTALGLSRAWLDRYEDLMALLGTLLVPVGGVLVSRLLLAREGVDPQSLGTPPPGPWHRRFAWSALLAWALGVAAYRLALPVGGTLPALVTALLADRVLGRLERSRPR